MNKPKKKIMFIFGTRPEALKLAPLIKLARKDKRFKVHICFTGQHREMAFAVLDLFGIKPDFDLNVMKFNQSLSFLTKRLLEKLDVLFQRVKPDIVVVQGDTTSAFVGALAAYYYKIAVAHVEAGLRSYDKYQPFPEEMNRAFVGRMADFHFAPTKGAMRNLLNEGIPKEKIYVTGNTVVDALKSVKAQLVLKKNSLIKQIIEKNNKIVLVTAHRRENFGRPLKEICRALNELTNKLKNIQMLFLVHKNPLVQATAYKHLGSNKSIHLLAPANYVEFLTMMKYSHFIISDSGGVQEEAPTFHKPVLVLRNVTERPEGVRIGVAKLVGSQSAKIVREGTRLMRDRSSYRKMSTKMNPYGDGKASYRIINILARS